jgi:hypothetical protein
MGDIGKFKPYGRSITAYLPKLEDEMGNTWTKTQKKNHAITQMAKKAGTPVKSKITNQLNGSVNPAEMDILKAFDIQEKISKKLEDDITKLSTKKTQEGSKMHHVIPHLYLMNKSLTKLIQSREEVNKKGSVIKMVVNKISGGIQQYDDFITSMINFVKGKIVNQFDDYEEVLKQTSLDPKYYYSELGLLAYLTKKHHYTLLTEFTSHDLKYLTEEGITEYKKRKREYNVLSLKNWARIKSDDPFGNANLKLNDPFGNANLKLNDPSGTGGRRTRRRRNKRRTHKKRN